VLFSVRGAAAVQEGAVKLGGLFNLSGTPFGAVSGSRGLLIRAQGYRNVSDAFGDIRMPVYAGFSLEAGNAVARDASLGWSDLRRAMALYVGADSLFGPVYLAVGRTIGGASGFYLLWGRPQ
jgi:NTE family protein